MSARMSINLDLPPQLDEFVRKQVASGRYRSADEVVLQSLQLFEDQERDRAAALQEVRDHIQEGIEQAERGELVHPARLLQKIEESFRFIIVLQQEQMGFLYGTLEAVALDPLMHPNGCASVNFSTGFPERKDGGHTIDSLQLDSLRSYVSGQPVIVAALGAALLQDRRCFVSNEGDDDLRTIWDHVTIEHVGFAPLTLVTTDSFVQLRRGTKGLSDELIGILAAESDPEGTWSKFIIVAKVDWSDESSPWREARFRNGQLVTIARA